MFNPSLYPLIPNATLPLVWKNMPRTIIPSEFFSFLFELAWNGMYFLECCQSPFCNHHTLVLNNSDALFCKTSILWLIGNDEQLKSVTRKFRVYYSKPPEDRDDYQVDHSIYFYLMNEKGKLIRYFGKDMPAESIAFNIMQQAQVLEGFTKPGLVLPSRIGWTM